MSFAISLNVYLTISVVCELIRKGDYSFYFDFDLRCGYWFFLKEVSVLEMYNGRSFIYFSDVRFCSTLALSNCFDDSKSWEDHGVLDSSEVHDDLMVSLNTSTPSEKSRMKISRASLRKSPQDSSTPPTSALVTKLFPQLKIKNNEEVKVRPWLYRGILYLVSEQCHSEHLEIYELDFFLVFKLRQLFQIPEVVAHDSFKCNNNNNNNNCYYYYYY